MPTHGQLTPEELEAYQRMYPGLPLEVPGTLAIPNAPVLANPTMAPAVVVPPTVSTGEAPAGLAPPSSSLTEEFKRLQAESQARLQAMESAPGPNRLLQGLSFAAHGAGDVARYLAAVRRGQTPPTGSTMRAAMENAREADAARAQQIQGERQYLVGVMNHIATSSVRDIQIWTEAEQGLARVAKNPMATAEDLEAGFERAMGLLAKNGQDTTLAARSFRYLLRQPELATTLGDYMPSVDPGRARTEAERQAKLQLSKTMMMGTTAVAMEGSPQAVAAISSRNRSLARQAISVELFRTARELADQRKARFGAQGIPLTELVDHLQLTQKDAVRPYLDLVLGLSDVSEGEKQDWDRMLTTLGYTGREVAVKAQEARATATGTALGKAEPVVAKAEAEAAVTKETIERPAKLETQRQQKRQEKELERLYREAPTLAERVVELRRAGKTDLADAIFKAEKELREAGRPPAQLPAGAVEQLATLDVFRQRLTEMRRLHKAEYTGPVDEWLASARERFGIRVTDREVAFRQIVAVLQDELLHLRTGAAVTLVDFERISREFPTIGLPDAVFLARAKRAAASVGEVIEKRMQYYRKFGFALPSGAEGAASAEPATTPSAETPRDTQERIREELGLPRRR